MFPETVAQQFGEQTFGGSAHETSRPSLRLTFFWSLSRKMFPESVASSSGNRSSGEGASGPRGLGQGEMQLIAQIPLRNPQWQRFTDANLEAVAYYCKATEKCEQQGLPCIGLCMDRRQLAQAAQAVHSDNIKSYVCLCCAQIRTWVRSWECAYHCSDTKLQQKWESREIRTDIRMMSVEKSLWQMYRQHPDAFDDNFGMDTFQHRYAAERSGNAPNPFQNTTDFDQDNYEWQRVLRLPDGTSKRLLCCPEDAVPSLRCRHADHVLCHNCQVPICTSCWWKFWSEKYDHRIPMALANDNFIGYTSEIIARFKVRWLEAAIVQPCWTNILIYYVEGDHGHLMNENMQNQRSRTVVRGGCVSYRMPWEDVLESLKKSVKDQESRRIGFGKNA